MRSKVNGYFPVMHVLGIGKDRLSIRELFSRISKEDPAFFRGLGSPLSSAAVTVPWRSLPTIESKSKPSSQSTDTNLDRLRPPMLWKLAWMIEQSLRPVDPSGWNRRVPFPIGRSCPANPILMITGEENIPSGFPTKCRIKSYFQRYPRGLPHFELQSIRRGSMRSYLTPSLTEITQNDRSIWNFKQD